MYIIAIAILLNFIYNMWRSFQNSRSAQNSAFLVLNQSQLHKTLTTLFFKFVVTYFSNELIRLQLAG